MDFVKQKQGMCSNSRNMGRRSGDNLLLVFFLNVKVYLGKSQNFTIP